MKIKCLRASFGKLQNSTLNLGSGLNIIEAPNESGKTTYCAFIKNILYGLNTSERDKAGYLSDKTRYRPWNGSAMEGTADLLVAGENITIQRTGTGSTPMRKFSAFYTGTNEPVEWLSSSTVGERLTGVPEKVFERTAFIHQSGVRIDAHADLEKRIASLISAGDEQVSFSEANTKLCTWRRKLRHNRSGTLPQLEEQLAQEKEKLSLLYQADETSTNLRLQLEQLTHQCKKLEEQLDLTNRFEAFDAAQRIQSAKEDVCRLTNEIEALKTQLTAENGHQITHEDLVEIRAALSSVDALKPVHAKLYNAKQDAEKVHRAAVEARCGSVLNSLSDEETSAAVKKAEQLAAESSKNIALQQRSTKQKRVISGSIAIFFAILSICILLGVFATPPMGIICAVVAVICAFFAIKKPHCLQKDIALQNFLEAMGVSSLSELQAAAVSHRTLLKNEQAAENRLLAAAQSFAETDSALSSACAYLKTVSNILPQQLSTREDMADAIVQSEHLLNLLTRAEQNCAAAQASLKSLQENQNVEMADFNEVSMLPRPQQDKATLTVELQHVRQQLSVLSESYNLSRGHAQSLGDPIVLAGKIQELSEKIAEQERTYRALTLAIDTLAEADTQLQMRLSPLINQQATQILSQLTDGKYEKLNFDKTFNANVKSTLDPVSHSMLSLSTGTIDQLYFALRLAMCELLLTSESNELCPIILDDALSNFDDNRMGAALRLLRTMANNRQILLFTCHCRERQFLADDPDVTFIRL